MKFVQLAVCIASTSAFVPSRPAARVAQLSAVDAPEAELAAPAPAPAAPPAFSVRDMAGVASFPGFFDPLGLSEGKGEERIMFYREAELKHGRVAMLAAL